MSGMKAKRLLSLTILLIILGVGVYSNIWRPEVSTKLESPSAKHILGTDPIGRDVAWLIA